MQGAAFWDWTKDGIDTSSSVPAQLDLVGGDFAVAAAEKGIAPDRRVVCYDAGEGGSMFALRVRWALRCHGHDDVYVLSGGWRAWQEAGGENSLHEPCPLAVRSCAQSIINVVAFVSSCCARLSMRLKWYQGSAQAIIMQANLDRQL